MTTEKKDTAVPHAKNKWQKGVAQIKKRWRLLLAGTALAGAGALATVEMNTSPLQARLFTDIAAGKKFTTTRTTDSATMPSAGGPYDERLGYTRALDFRRAILQRGYVLQRENTWQERRIAGIDLFPIYTEKAQAGLHITDYRGRTMFRARYPGNVYSAFDSIPAKLVNSLLFVENRELLDSANHPRKNPAIEWERFVHALMGYGMKQLGANNDHAGGSTLATQMEKFRHSPGGMTSSGREKLRQMLTASVRAYQDGDTTVNARRDIVLNYLNTMPLSAFPGVGEIHGFGDGISAWFGRDFAETNRLLSMDESRMTVTDFREAARAYREMLSLVMAVKKPSAYLIHNRAELDARIDAYLPLLEKEKIISPTMRKYVALAKVQYATPASAITADPDKSAQKSVGALQVELLNTLKMKSVYDLNRLDLTARTTIDAEVDRAVYNKLHALNNPDTAAAIGLTGFRLLNRETADQVVYAFTLYERMADGSNVIRVQTDNYDGPLNLNEGSKLELGSTAKLRTFVTYLEAIADLHGKYSRMDSTQLAAVNIHRDDNLTRWTVNYLSQPDNDKSLNAVLEASLDRRYSASTGERFFTGGGVHRFSNFDGKDNGRSPTVKESLHRSINLPFIRMMRDIVHYTMYQKMNLGTDIMTDINNPARRPYLEQFARDEGSLFMWKFFQEQDGKTPMDIAGQLAAKTRGTPNQLAIVFRTVFPHAPVGTMKSFIERHAKSGLTPRTDFDKIYETYAPGKFDLNDLGYLTRVHPLGLWLAQYKTQNPDAGWSETVEAARDVQVFVYSWLFRGNKLAAQNKRIRTMIEKEAFEHIHASWKEKGYPFNTMTPSYAAALGASGDTPAALSTFVGILQNDGRLAPAAKFYHLDFGRETPYALDFRIAADTGRRVLPVEITRITRREMENVVEHGTARRAFQSIKLSDGRILPVGAKTGTGDNRQQTFNARGGVLSSTVKSRTATFVYTIDDRFFGCIVAYVEGPAAAKYRFTSSLPAQIFKSIAPEIRPLLDNAYGINPPVPLASDVAQPVATPPAAETPVDPPALPPVENDADTRPAATLARRGGGVPKPPPA